MELKQYLKMSNDKSLRHVDDNGYLYVQHSPILKSGILEYYGSELVDNDKETIDGLKIDLDKIYKVYISDEELEKSKDTFTLLPLVNDHTWLGVEGDDAKDFQEGTTGENAFVKDGMLLLPLKFTGVDTIEQIQNNQKEELSASYTNKLIRSDNQEYDFIAVDLKGNHVALVEQGRCGSDVRVLNSNSLENNKMVKKMKNEDTKLIIGDKEVDLNQFFDQEEKESVHAGTGSIEDVDNEGVDKRKLIDEMGGILKGKVDDEVIRTILKKAEELSYNDSERSADNEEADMDNADVDEIDKKLNNEDYDDVDDKDKNSSKTNNSKAVFYENMARKIVNSVKQQHAREEKEKVRAYNSVKDITGDFNPFGMSATEIYKYGLQQAGIQLEGNESIPEMKAMLKVCNTRGVVDESFSYQKSGATDEITINF